ncbi:hypothetical protein [Corallococcus exiguus]|uniref:hypothetical protein n=1 Tax=Corallococcus exiguus TaxID=83462 RepID=UPI003DA2FBCD
MQVSLSRRKKRLRRWSLHRPAVEREQLRQLRQHLLVRTGVYERGVRLFSRKKGVQWNLRGPAVEREQLRRLRQHLSVRAGVYQWKVRLLGGF